MISIVDPVEFAAHSGLRGKEFSMPETQPDPMPFYHEPVLLAEVVRALQPKPGMILMDGTLGGGGHTEALLEAGARVIGVDQDPEALAYAGFRLERFGKAFMPVRSNFSTVDEILTDAGLAGLDGALLDLGVSSRQLDAAERGFSFMREGPLDMRMDPDLPHSAADLLNAAEPEQIEEILRVFGEEPLARRITNEIVRQRGAHPFQTTLDLAGCIENVSPRRGRTHPATRTFQALRIAVNRELDVLHEAMPRIASLLKPGGRFGIITFHSLEDRIVKTFFRERSAEFIDRPEWPAAKPNPGRLFRQITHKPLVASEEEQQRNPRSRSAKLRVVERI